MVAQQDQLPHAVLWELQEAQNEEGVEATQLLSFDAREEARDKSVVIFSVTNAFTQTCTQTQLPSYLALVSHFQNIGVDQVWCISTNDAYVMHAWGKTVGINQRIRMLSDGNFEFTNALELQRDMRQYGMGTRSQRYSMFVRNGVVEILNVDPEGKLVVTDAQQLYLQIQGLLDK